MPSEACFNAQPLRRRGRGPRPLQVSVRWCRSPVTAASAVEPWAIWIRLTSVAGGDGVLLVVNRWCLGCVAAWFRGTKQCWIHRLLRRQPGMQTASSHTGVSAIHKHLTAASPVDDGILVLSGLRRPRVRAVLRFAAYHMASRPMSCAQGLLAGLR